VHLNHFRAWRQSGTKPDEDVRFAARARAHRGDVEDEETRMPAGGRPDDRPVVRSSCVD
jgi:hypothetical protein